MQTDRFFWWVGNKRKISWNRNLKCWQRRWGGVDVEKSKHYLDLYLGVQWREDFPGKRLSCKVKDLYTDFRRWTKLSWNSPKSTVLSEWSIFSTTKGSFEKTQNLHFLLVHCQGGQKDNMYCHIQVKLTSINESGFWSKWFAMRQLWARPTVILSSNILFFILANKCASSSNINKNENFLMEVVVRVKVFGG